MFKPELWQSHNEYRTIVILVNAFNCRFQLWIADAFTRYAVQTAIICVCGYNTYGRRLSRNDPKYSFGLYDKQRQMLLGLNLDPLAGFIPQFYSGTGCPAKNQAQILRSLILFTLLFNQIPARTSLSLWVTAVLPNSISLTVLVGCTCTQELPPLGSYTVTLLPTARGPPCSPSLPCLPSFPPYVLALLTL